MKGIAVRTVLGVATIAAMLMGSAEASVAGDSPQVTRHVGNRTFYSDGTVEVEIAAGTMSLSECRPGQFCVWSHANYQGSFRYRTRTGSKTLGGTVGSFWNNRSTVARLYNNTGSSSTCYENGVRKATVSASYSSAETVSLSSSANC